VRLANALTVVMQLARADVQRHDMREMVTRKRAAIMLFLGASSGLVGFLFAFAIGALKTYSFFHLWDSYCYRSYDNQRLNPCYFPATVSEMVYDPEAPAGKVFFFFEFTGAILIFFSWYPTSLRSVYIGDDASVPCTNVAWVSFRQYIPAPGMMMLSVISTVPAAQADLLDGFCITLHLTGALMMFVGYFFAEGVAVGWGPFHRCVPDEKRQISSVASTQRKVALTVIALSYTLFCILTVVLSVGSGDEFDQWDMVKNCTDTRLGKDDCAKPQLIKAAKWSVKMMKKTSYGCEVVCGLSVIASHLLIWYHCEERHYDLPEELYNFGVAGGDEEVVARELHQSQSAVQDD